jgi:hypothetical protein
MLNPSHDFNADATHCAFGASFIVRDGDPAALWPLWPGFLPDTSFFVFSPTRRKRVRRRRVSARKRALAYAALNIAGDYVDDAQAALRAGDDSAARSALEVLRGLVEVALGLINPKPVLQ